ncbi:MAG: hypothetical protein AAF939_01735 [Planctomycetota bacterium]
MRKLAVIGFIFFFLLASKAWGQSQIYHETTFKSTDLNHVFQRGIVISGITAGQNGWGYACCNDQIVRRFHLATGRWEPILQHEQWPKSIVYCPEKAKLFSGGHDGQVIIWSSKNGTVDRIQVDFPIRSIDIDATGNRLVVAGVGSEIRTYHHRLS